MRQGCKFRGSSQKIRWSRSPPSSLLHTLRPRLLSAEITLQTNLPLQSPCCRLCFLRGTQAKTLK
ncbi:hCG2036845, isoform CRA_a [Homo sapiens]|uniref:Putative uncharacterized protein encoded by LINC00310 n=1 Tax=Homo sapiens TaxID=9606 RepID=CU082_HUMAN